MRETSPKTAHARRSELIIEKTKDTLTGRSTEIHSTNTFTVDSETAEHIAEAINSRNHAKLTEPFEPLLQDTLAEYRTTSPHESEGVLLDALEPHLQTPAKRLLDIITDSQHRAALDHAITTSPNQLSLPSYDYLKLLEALLVAETPDDITLTNRYRDNPKKFRPTQKHQTAPALLYARAETALDQLATDQPGIRQVRTSIENGKIEGLDNYLNSLSTSRIARDILSNHYDSIVQTGPDGMPLALQKKGEMRYLLGENEETGEIPHFEILEWSMLDDDEDSARAFINSSIKPSLERHEQEAWDESRLDLAFRIAAYANEQNRDPKVYISSTFRSGGGGAYVAVSISHPNDPTKRMVIAENPVYGNAAYFVDELATEIDEETGQPYTWTNVLNANKAAARTRGAVARRHVGNWQSFALNFLDEKGAFPREEQEMIETPLGPNPHPTTTEQQSDTADAPSTIDTAPHASEQDVRALLERNAVALSRAATVLSTIK